jgi:hypothetical protein
MFVGAFSGAKDYERNYNSGWGSTMEIQRRLRMLSACYLAETRFYRNQVLGDALYTGAIFGGHAAPGRVLQPARQAA